MDQMSPPQCLNTFRLTIMDSLHSSSSPSTISSSRIVKDISRIRCISRTKDISRTRDINRSKASNRGNSYTRSSRLRFFPPHGSPSHNPQADNHLFDPSLPRQVNPVNQQVQAMRMGPKRIGNNSRHAALVDTGE
jgi:hypothetical protein